MQSCIILLFMHTIGQRIRREMKRLKITNISDLARRSDADPSTLNRIINDVTRNPTPPVMLGVAVALGVSVDYLIGRTNSQ
jgi:transcriptional regulator with XRE-family HTH domain